jgi:hypothetical protein
MKILILIMTVLAIVGMVGIPEGRCPKCGRRYHGWALRNPRRQTCPKCGRGLEIRNSNDTTSRGYSPFNAEGYLLNPPDKVTHTDESANNSHEKDK